MTLHYQLFCITYNNIIAYLKSRRIERTIYILYNVTRIEGQSGKNMCQGGGKPDTGKFHHR